MERPPSNSMGFQLPLHNPMPSGGSVQGCPPSFELVFEIYKFDNNHNLIDWCHFITPGHTFSQVPSGRPDIPGLNCWRPA